MRGRPPIDPVANREEMFEHPTRRAIARRCRTQPHSVQDLAKCLSRAPQGLKKTVESMRKWEVLTEAGKTSRGAAMYLLAPSWRKDLENALERIGPRLAAKQRLLLVTGEIPVAAAALAEQRLDTSWAVAWNGPRGMLLGLGDSVSDAAVADLVQDVKRVGGECRLVELTEAIPGSQVISFLKGIDFADSDD